MKQNIVFVVLVVVCTFKIAIAQDVSLFQQFNGRYDYISIGNTLNQQENGLFAPCVVNTVSSAELTLQDNQTLVAAYLYWAGSGSGDFEIEVNGNPITAERTFLEIFNGTREYFAGFYDVTDIVMATGNGIYTISELDISDVISGYCPTGSNFAGWAITVIYQDDALPLNLLNIYDGLEGVGGIIGTVDSLSITIDSLNVLDNEGAKIGFLAWEGDESLAVSEQLTINGNIISNPPLNPANNAFNSTNSFTGATDLFNMDIDVYDIQDNISIGDTSATIALTSGQDYVMINNIITVLNSQLPDATVSIDTIETECGSRDIRLDYSVFNLNSTEVLPANVSIAFYVEDILLGQTVTTAQSPIGGSESGFIDIALPDFISDTFELIAIVDDDGNGNGLVTEINETNNTDSTSVELLILPDIEVLDGATGCDIGNDKSEFDLMALATSQLNAEVSNISFYETFENLQEQTNEILNTSTYGNDQNPQPIYVRVEDLPCDRSYVFNLIVENCPPIVPQGFSPNNDGKNDWFNIQGLYDIFKAHELFVYNRYGVLIFKGDNDNPWKGYTNRGIGNTGKRIPVGTYFYVLQLNDSNYQPIQGYVYVNY